MIALHAVLDRPEIRRAGRREDPPQELVHVVRPQAREPRAHAHRHEHREPRRELLSLRVRHPGPLARRFPPRPPPLPAPAHESELTLPRLALHAEPGTRPLGI